MYAHKILNEYNDITSFLSWTLNQANKRRIFFLIKPNTQRSYSKDLV
jgi:hypothetical protein